MESDIALQSEDDDLLKSTGYINEIPSMLQAFGDMSTASPQAINLINDFVYDQLSLLLHQAESVAEQRLSPTIGIEEFMFLCRKNTKRLFHFMRHLQFRDTKNKFQDSADLKQGEALLHKKNTALLKRTRLCLQFLGCIDPLSDLETSFHEEKFDDIRIQRLRMAELVTRHMDMKQYSKFCTCRHISFSQNMRKFQDWLRPVLDTLAIQPSKFGWESLAYFSHETVATLVYFVLLVKSEQYSSEVQSHSNSLERMLLNEDARRNFATTPALVHEALRRCCLHHNGAKNSCFNDFFTSSYPIIVLL